LGSRPGTRPAADVRTDLPLVRRLVAGQFPQWADLAIEPVESAGWDNAIFRLGHNLTVRLPRRRVSADHVRNEHRWLPVLAATNLARFIAALQAIDPVGGSVHDFRGVSLAAHDRNARTAAAVLQHSFDVSPVLEVWEEAVAAPAWTGRPL
jgi:aminoglycoside phosphotransferase (APT) family kinase protein